MEILPGIWLGDKDIAYNKNFLRKKDIGCVINVTKEIPHNPDYDGEKIRIPVTERNMSIFDYLSDVTEFIKKKNNNFENVLIFSTKCEQRAPSVMVAYLTRYGKVTAELAIKYIVSKGTQFFDSGVIQYKSLVKFHKRCQTLK